MYTNRRRQHVFRIIFCKGKITLEKLNLAKNGERWRKVEKVAKSSERKSFSQSKARNTLESGNQKFCFATLGFDPIFRNRLKQSGEKNVWEEKNGEEWRRVEKSSEEWRKVAKVEKSGESNFEWRMKIIIFLQRYFPLGS